jgi:hypothetical protein
LDRRLDESQSQFGCCGEGKNLLPLPGIEYRPSLYRAMNFRKYNYAVTKYKLKLKEQEEE